MDKENWLLKAMNVRREEARPVLLLMLFSFFVGLSLTFYFTASNAIFLKHFPSKIISFSYVASGIVVYLAWLLLSRLDRRMSVPNQLLVKILFVFLSVLAISAGVWLYDTSWLAFVMFTWVRVLVYITLVTFWGLAGKIFNIRQGKRIFGLIGIGEVISIIIGYFSVPLILRFLKAADLLFLSSASLLVCVAIALVIIRTFGSQLGATATPVKQVKKEAGEWNYRKLLRKPYFMLISLMAFLPIFGYLFTDFLFLAQTRKEFTGNPEAIAGFLGLFLGFVAIVELIFKLISGRFLNKYGLKPSLVSLPVILAFSILLAAVFGSIYGGVGLFFAFIAMARLFERAVRGSTYEPAFQLLYQPVPEEQRLVFQNQIEGIPKALGTVITGAVIFGLSVIPVFSLVHFNWIFLVVLIAWIYVSFRMYGEYRSQLKKKLAEIRDEDRKEAADEKSVYATHLADGGAGEFRAVYRLCRPVTPVAVEEALEEAFTRGNHAVKEAVLEAITADQLLSCQGWIRNVLESGKHPQHNESLESTLKELKEAENLPFDFLSSLCRSADAGTRERMAWLLGYSGRYNTYKLLAALLRDPSPEVRKAAIISSGRTRRYELWHYLVENLGSPVYGFAAAQAVRMVGEPVLGEIDQHFAAVAGNRRSFLGIIRLCESMGGEKAIRFLRSKISWPDPELRFQALLSLSNLEYRATYSEIPLIRQTIEESVDIIVWIMASMADIQGSPDTLDIQNALLEELEERKENIFLLLSLIYDPKTIRHIRESIESPDMKARIYAMEILDMTVSEDIRAFFLPLFEDITIHERLHRFRLNFPQEKMNKKERLQEIISKDFSRIGRWTKSCAMELLAERSEGEPGPCCMLLAANLVNPDPLLAETAAYALSKRNPAYFAEQLAKYIRWSRFTLPASAGSMLRADFDPATLLCNRVKQLKNHPLFAPMPESSLTTLAMGCDGKELPSPGAILEFVSGDLLQVDRYLNHFIHEQKNEKSKA
jgi:hypothetical protein